MVSPAAVTWGSFRLSAALQAVCESVEKDERADILTSSFALPRSFFMGVRIASKGLCDRLRAEACFCMVKLAWLAEGAGSWFYTGGVFLGIPLRSASL